MVRAVDDHETTTGQLRQPVGAGDRLAVIVRAVNDEQRTAHVAADRLDRIERPGLSTLPSASIASTGPSSAQPTMSSRTLVEWGSEVSSPKKNERNRDSRVASSAR